MSALYNPVDDDWCDTGRMAVVTAADDGFGWSDRRIAHSMQLNGLVQENVAVIFGKYRCVILLCLSEDNAQILAACLYQYVADEAELLQIFVHASSRGQGIGRQLLEASIDLLIIKEILYIYLEVSEQNTPAIGLYSSFGFQEIGVRGGYYRHQDGSAADALQMRFELQSTLA